MEPHKRIITQPLIIGEAARRCQKMPFNDAFELQHHLSHEEIAQNVHDAITQLVQRWIKRRPINESEKESVRSAVKLDQRGEQQVSDDALEFVHSCVLLQEHRDRLQTLFTNPPVLESLDDIVVLPRD